MKLQLLTQIPVEKLKWYSRSQPNFLKMNGFLYFYVNCQHFDVMKYSQYRIIIIVIIMRNYKLTLS